MRSLIRSQLRIALAVLTILLLTIGILPIVLWLFEPIREQTIASVPMPWWILGVACYPCLIALGWLYLRQAERAERDFTAIVDGESENP